MKKSNTNVSKKVAVIAMTTAAAFSLMGCTVEKTVTITETHEESQPAEAAELVTYEFETFDNLKVVLDENSIVAQEPSDDPEHSELVSAEAVGNIIAPGRDFVYLEDDNNYYVADYSRNLITVADKSKVQVEVVEASEEVEGVGDLIEDTDFAIFDNDVFTFTYDPQYFIVTEDEEYVTVSFYNEETQIAGSDTISFTEKENADAQEVAKEYAKLYGMDEGSVQETYFGSTGATAYSFNVTPSDEAESGSKTRAMVCAVASGDNVIVIDVLTHVEPDEGLDMFINDKIAEVLDTFDLR